MQGKIVGVVDVDVDIVVVRGEVAGGGGGVLLLMFEVGVVVLTVGTGIGIGIGIGGGSVATACVVMVWFGLRQLLDVRVIVNSLGERERETKKEKKGGCFGSHKPRPFGGSRMPKA